MKYAWIKEHRDEYSVVRMCRAMRVSKSGFYKWLNSDPSPRSKRTALIRASGKSFKNPMASTAVTRLLKS